MDDPHPKGTRMSNDPLPVDIVLIEREGDGRDKSDFVEFRNEAKRISFVAQHTNGTDKWFAFRVPHPKSGYVSTISGFDGPDAKEKAVHTAYEAACAAANDRFGLSNYQAAHRKETP